MASDALAQGFDELMWIDSDGVFDPDDVDKLRQHDLPLVCGICAKKSCRQRAPHLPTVHTWHGSDRFRSYREYAVFLRSRGERTAKNH
jgi:hypothetical protein